MLRRISSTLKIGLALFVAVFSNGLLPHATAYAAPPTDNKVFVCKYVGTPGVDERLQTGTNPISVSTSSIQNNQWDGTVPGWFSDAHDRSYVLSYDNTEPGPAGDPNVSSCPAPEGPKPANPTILWTINECEVGDINQRISPSVFNTDDATDAAVVYTLEFRDATTDAAVHTDTSPSIPDGGSWPNTYINIFPAPGSYYMYVTGSDGTSFTSAPFTINSCSTTPQPAAPQISFTLDPCLENDRTNRVNTAVTNTDDATDAAVVYTLQFRDAGTDAVVHTDTSGSIADGDTWYNTYINELTPGDYYIHIAGSDGTSVDSGTFTVNSCVTTPEPTEIPVPVIGVNDPCDANNATWQTPPVTAHVSWSTDSNGNPVATADQGYVFANNQTVHNYGNAPETNTQPCQQPCDNCACNHDCQNEPTKVTPTAPMFTDICDTKNDNFIILSTPGVIYKDKVSGDVLASGPHNNVTGTVTIIAVDADNSDDFVIKDGAATEWSHTFTNEDCPPLPPNPIDVCPNLPNNQTVVPIGYTKDQNGNCVTGGGVGGDNDVCPNITGPQKTIPNGYTKDNQGNCVAPTTPPQTPPQGGNGGGQGGQILGQAAAVVLPESLPETGGASFLSQWLPMVAGVLTYGSTSFARSRKQRA